MARNVTAVLNVKPKIRGMSFQSTIDGMVDGLVEAAILNLAHPAAPVLTLQTTKKLKFIRFTEEDFARILKAYPMYRTVTMAQNIYNDFPKGGYKTLQIGTAVLTHKDFAVLPHVVDVDAIDRGAQPFVHRRRRIFL